jgi:hypothetical protein
MGLPHQIYVEPMRSAPWWILTFGNEEVWRTANIETGVAELPGT